MHHHRFRGGSRTTLPPIVGVLGMGFAGVVLMGVAGYFFVTGAGPSVTAGVFAPAGAFLVVMSLVMWKKRAKSGA